MVISVTMKVIHTTMTCASRISKFDEDFCWGGPWKVQHWYVPNYQINKWLCQNLIDGTGAVILRNCFVSSAFIFIEKTGIVIFNFQKVAKCIKTSKICRFFVVFTKT